MAPAPASERFLQLEETGRRTTKIDRLRTRRRAEHPYSAFVDEPLRFMGRKEWHEAIEGVRKDLKPYPPHRNDKRLRQGLKARAPDNAVIGGLPKKGSAVLK